MKYALITGASGGIGSEIALALAKEGFRLYLHYNENEKAINELRLKLLDKTDSITIIKADLSKKSGVKQLADSIATPIDSLILNSGKSYVGLITDMADSEVEEMVQLHITSPFMLTKALLPSMIQRKKGNIVAISSIWGQTGASCEVLYSMVKGGTNTFVKALAKEVAPSGIRVNGVAPGAISTQMLSNLTEEEKGQLCDEIPMGRLGDPKEVAELVVFLSSEKATYINGQIIGINGAWY